MKKILGTCIVAFAASTGAVQASDLFSQVFGDSNASEARFDAMSGAQLRQVISDRKVFLDTPLGTRLPISYSSDGTMTGEGGSLAKYLSSRKLVVNDSGTWWITKNKLCQKWQNWLKGKRSCIKARKVGRKVFWISDAGDKGTAYLGPRLKLSSEKPREASPLMMMEASLGQ